MTHNGQGVPAGAAAIVTALADAGTRVVFGLPGGGPNLDVVGAAALAGLRFVLARTETAAVIMAATYADLTGLPGAALVTRGPGLARAVNGIAHAALDRLPVVVIADTVRLADAGRISHQRLDQAALGAVVAKAVVTIGRDRTGEAAAAAVRLALMPPAGPVVALMDDSGISDPGDAPGPERSGRASDDGGPRDVAVLAQALRRSRRPVIMTLAEIETAARLRLRIAVVVFNDGALSLIKIKQRPAGQGGAEAVDFGPVSYARTAQALGAVGVAVSTEKDLAAALSAASGRDGPTVVDVQLDPAGYPAIMDLSRGEAGQRPVPGLPGPGPRPAAGSATTVRSIQCRLPWRNSRMSPRAPSPASSRSASARPCRAWPIWTPASGGCSTSRSPPSSPSWGAMSTPT